MLISDGKIWYNSRRSSGKAGVAQWQSSSLPSWLRGFDSLRPLQGKFSQGGVMAAAADSKSAVREYVRVRVPPLAPDGRSDWRGVRVVDGATLERLCGRKSTGGSNPPPSASVFPLILLDGNRLLGCNHCRDFVETLRVTSSRRRCGKPRANHPRERRWRRVSAASRACRRKGAGGRRERRRSAVSP